MLAIAESVGGGANRRNAAAETPAARVGAAVPEVRQLSREVALLHLRLGDDGRELGVGAPEVSPPAPAALGRAAIGPRPVDVLFRLPGAGSLEFGVPQGGEERAVSLGQALGDVQRRIIRAQQGVTAGGGYRSVLSFAHGADVLARVGHDVAPAEDDLALRIVQGRAHRAPQWFPTFQRHHLDPGPLFRCESADLAVQAGLPTPVGQLLVCCLLEVTDHGGVGRAAASRPLLDAQVRVNGAGLAPFLRATDRCIGCHGSSQLSCSGCAAPRAWRSRRESKPERSNTIVNRLRGSARRSVTCRTWCHGQAMRSWEGWRQRRNWKLSRCRQAQSCS